MASLPVAAISRTPGTAWSVLLSRAASQARFDGAVIIALATIGVFGAATVLEPEACLADSSAYIGLAHSLVATGNYVFDGQPHTFYPPGFPLILAGISIFTRHEGYDAFIRWMPVLGALALAAWYFALAPSAGRVRAATACLVVATSLSYYQLVTQGVMSDGAFMAATGVALASLQALDTRSMTRATRASLGLLAVVATAAAVLIRSAGITLCAGLVAWTAVASFRRGATRSPAWRASLSAACAGLVVFTLWIGWCRAAQRASGTHLRTYSSQISLKDPHQPDHGPATIVDLAVRPLANLPQELAGLSTVFVSLAWIDPIWYSPFVIVPLLLLVAGVVSFVRDERRSRLAWYFLAYGAVYLLWPFTSERVRFLLPIAPLAFVLMWEGVRVAVSLVAAGFVTAARVGVVAAGIAAGALATGMPGLQARASVAGWIALATASLLCGVSRPAWRTARQLRRVQAACAVALAGLALAGLMREIGAARANRSADPSRFVHYREVQAAAWLRRAPEGVVMAQQLEIVHRLTGRLVELFPATGDARAIIRAAREEHVRYLLVNARTRDEYVLPTEEDRYRAIDRTEPGLLQLRHNGPGYRIFELQAPR